MVGPFNASQGDLLEINFDVQNVGTAPGTQDILLTAEDGTKFTADTLQDLSLNEGEVSSGTLQWDIALDQQKELYEVCVETSDGTDCVTVNLVDVPASAVSRWTFNDTDTVDGVSLDLWGNNDGTITGATTSVSGANVTYDTREAYAFDGSDDQVVINSSLVDGFGFTISGWVKPRSDGVLLAIGDSSNDDYGHGVAIRNGNASTNVNGTTFTNIESISVTDGSYHHIVGTISQDTIGVYVDGGNFNSTNHLQSFGALDISTIGRAADSTPAGSFIDGDIDDVRVYDKILSATEVSNLYNTGNIAGN